MKGYEMLFSFRNRREDKRRLQIESLLFFHQFQLLDKTVARPSIPRPNMLGLLFPLRRLCLLMSREAGLLDRELTGQIPGSLKDRASE